MERSIKRKPTRISTGEKGFTLMETAIALVMMFVVSLGAASLFAYASNANTNADDRELAMAIAQKRLEWLRTIPFTIPTRSVAYAYPNGGLAATSPGGVVETVTNAGRSYQVTTTIVDNNFVPAGNPDAGACTLKTIKITVTPLGAANGFRSFSV